MANYSRMTRSELIERLRSLETRMDDPRSSPGGRGVTEGPREGDERLRAILETAVEGIIAIDERGRIESLNRAAEEIFGYREREILGENVHVLMPQPYRDEHDGYLKNYLKSGEAKIIGIGREVAGRRKSGEVFPMDLAVSEVQLANRRVFTGFVRDITERRELEKEILDARHREQERIGRDLHDNLGQQLTGIEFMSQAMEQKLASAGNRHAADAAEIARLVRQAITHTRGLSRGLNPIMVESEGLMAALRDLAENTEQVFSTKCHFDCPSPVYVEDNSTAIHLFRIAQESVNNAIKHGKPSRIEIALKDNGDRILLAVKDDGRGLPDKPNKKTGMGLRIMQYRAGIIGGSLVIQKPVGGGAEIVCSVRRGTGKKSS